MIGKPRKSSQKYARFYAPFSIEVLLSDQSMLVFGDHLLMPSVDKSEIKHFIENICLEIGMDDTPDEQTLNDVFEELDEDGSDDIDLDEMKTFLRKRDDTATLVLYTVRPVALSGAILKLALLYSLGPACLVKLGADKKETWL